MVESPGNKFGRNTFIFVMIWTGQMSTFTYNLLTVCPMFSFALNPWVTSTQMHPLLLFSILDFLFFNFESKGVSDSWSYHQ